MSAYRSAGDIFANVMVPIALAIIIVIVVKFLIILGIGVFGYRYIVPQSERTTFAYIVIIIISVGLTWWKVYLGSQYNSTQNAPTEPKFIYASNHPPYQRLNEAEEHSICL